MTGLKRRLVAVRSTDLSTYTMLLIRKKREPRNKDNRRAYSLSRRYVVTKRSDYASAEEFRDSHISLRYRAET